MLIGKGLRDTINALCLKRIKRKPNLENPSGYNDLIQWLKLHDQRAEHITACDKWAVRKWVAERVTRDVLIPASLGWPPKRLPCFAKCTHDSGSARRLTRLDSMSDPPRNLVNRLGQPYGIEKGEWAYQFVPPQIICEDMLADEVTDYKFHCSHGTVKWVQVIWDRRSPQTREAILTPEGKPTDLHMDHNMRHCPEAHHYPGDYAWEVLTELATKLCAGWRYVRVDLYWVGKPYFGELTFWPLAGTYATQDEPRFGDMLELDLSYRFPPIVQ